MKTIAFFNNKGGVGTTSLVYHLTWMYADLGLKVLATDLDPQANLTSMFLEEQRLEEIWPDGDHPDTILGSVRPILKGIGDIRVPHVERIEAIPEIGLIPGDLGLSLFEDTLSGSWPTCLDEDERAFRSMSAFYRLMTEAGRKSGADLILIDVGPNLGAINRAALIAAEYVVIPLAPDLFSLQGLRNLGPTLRKWRKDWLNRIATNPEPDELPLPSGEMKPVGYVVLQHAIRLDRPVQAYARWMNRIPSEYRESVLGETVGSVPTVVNDRECLALLKHYRSLMPMAMEARKPMFSLKPADGAIGAHLTAVQGCYGDFKELAVQIAKRCDIALKLAPIPYASEKPA